MAPTPSPHGPLFDVFTAASGSPHGGAQHDEFGHPDSGSNKHGARFDEGFRPAVANDSHGEHWDEFGWQPMPALHGQNFDSDFAAPTTLEGVDHGSTWYDVFRGGATQVRAIVDGRDVEAVVLECHTDHVVAELRRGKNQGGGRVELGLGQIKELRTATQQGQARETRKPVAHPGNTPAPQKQSPAHAPSAHSSARGGGERTSIEAPGGSKALHVTGKSMDDALDVLKDLRSSLGAGSDPVAGSRELARRGESKAWKITAAGHPVHEGVMCHGCAHGIASRDGMHTEHAGSGGSCNHCGTKIG